MPVFPTKLSELVAANVPPPLNVMPAMPHQSPVQLLADEMVAAPLVGLSLCKSVLLDELPDMPVKVVTVVVVPDVKSTLFPADIVRVAIVLAPVITKLDEPLATETTLYVFPPPEKRRDPVPPVPVNAIVEPFWLSVRFVTVLKFQNAELLESVQVPFPMLRVRVLVPEQTTPEDPVTVMELLFVAKSSVPVIVVITRLMMVGFVFTVIVPPFRPDAWLSMVTSSEAPGTD
jgi:hypothetical protein